MAFYHYNLQQVKILREKVAELERNCHPRPYSDQLTKTGVSHEKFGSKGTISVSSMPKFVNFSLLLSSHSLPNAIVLTYVYLWRCNEICSRSIPFRDDLHREI